jgi:L-serine deaminase
MTFTVFDAEGNMLATNQYFSIGGGFVVNNETQVAENMYYRDIHSGHAEESRREFATSRGEKIVAITDKGTDGPGTEAALSHRPPYLFATAEELHNICVEHNMTIAQVMWENERAFRTAEEIEAGLLHLWHTMDGCIRAGVTTTETHLPGGLNVKRRAPGLYRRLQQGFYPSVPVPKAHGVGPGTALDKPERPTRIGRVEHPVEIVPLSTRPVFPGIEYLSCMAIAVNEVNASGGRVVTAPTNGAAGVIPSTLKYTLEYISTQPRRDTMNFLLTASAIGMLFKRGATISAAEGGCMAEVGVACSMAAAALASILGAEPATILQAAEIGIEHNLGLTCDPLGGLVQIPCIERNSLGAVKAVTAAQLAMAASGEHTVSLDDAIEACRTTAMDMHSHYKETSLGGLAASVKIPLSSPAC